MTRPVSPTRDALELTDDLYSAISTLRRRAARQGGVWAAPSLSGAQIELLKLIRRQPLLSVAEAATELGLVPITVSTLVRQLDGADLLERVHDTADRRVVRLRVTEPALRTMRRWNDRRAAATATAIDGLTQADRRTLARAIPVLAALASSLDEGSVQD